MEKLQHKLMIAELEAERAKEADEQAKYEAAEKANKEVIPNHSILHRAFLN